MEHQLTFADSEFSSKCRQTRKEIFLSRMNALLPRSMFLEFIRPVYPKAGNDRQPYPLQTIFWIHYLQHWYNLSGGAMKNALYEIASMRLFTHLSLDGAPRANDYHELPALAGSDQSLLVAVINVGTTILEYSGDQADLSDSFRLISEEMIKYLH